MPARKASILGFSLIELMVAMSIVAILAAIGMTFYGSTQGTARDAKRKGDLQDIKQALYGLKASKGKLTKPAQTDPGFLFWPNYGSWADSAGVGGTVGMNPKSAGSMGGNLVEQGYLKAPLHDPKCPSTGPCTEWPDYYLQVISDDVFNVFARLETAPATSMVGCDPSLITASTAVVAAVRSYNYCISQ